MQPETYSPNFLGPILVIGLSQKLAHHFGDSQFLQRGFQANPI